MITANNRLVPTLVYFIQPFPIFVVLKQCLRYPTLSALQSILSCKSHSFDFFPRIIEAFSVYAQFTLLTAQRSVVPLNSRCSSSPAITLRGEDEPKQSSKAYAFKDTHFPPHIVRRAHRLPSVYGAHIALLGCRLEMTSAYLIATLWGVETVTSGSLLERHI